LLATGVVGIVYVAAVGPLVASTKLHFSMFLATIPAVIWVDKVGRKPLLVSGAFLMAA
jgi:hypothetical protein